MSVIPDIILQRAIIDGFQKIRKDPRIINMLFKNLPIDQQEDIKNFILKKNFDFSLNYPKSELKLPAFVLLMKSEAESQNFLGDLMGAPPNYDMPDADMEIETLGGAGASISNQQGLPDKVVGPLQVSSMLPTRNAITFVTTSQDLMDEVFSVRSNWPPMKLHIVAGKGVGKVYDISGISSEQLDIVGTFALDLDSTSLVDIRYATAPEAAYGSPVSAYTQSTGQLRIGANYDAQYQLDVLAGNQQEVIYLYTILKSILFAQRGFLEAQGIENVKITGSDLGIRPELLPEESFMRSMTIQFIYPFNFIVEQEVANAINIVFTNVNPATATPTPGGEVIVARIEL